MPDKPTLSTEQDSISIVIPFFNEGPNVSALLSEVRVMAEAMHTTYEVLAIDDGSTDETQAELHRLSREWPHLHVIRHPSNRGQAASLWTGFLHAQSPVIVTLDGDGQNDPADIPRLLWALRAGADMVAGIRVARQDSRLRKVMSRIANSVRARLLGDGIHDSGCAIKAFRREVCASFLPIRTLYSFMPALAVSAGYRVQEIPVHHRERKAGTSKYGLRAMLWRPLIDMAGILWFTGRRFNDTCP